MSMNVAVLGLLPARQSLKLALKSAKAALAMHPGQKNKLSRAEGSPRRLLPSAFSLAS